MTGKEKDRRGKEASRNLRLVYYEEILKIINLPDELNSRSATSKMNKQILRAIHLFFKSNFKEAQGEKNRENVKEWLDFKENAV